MSFLKKIIDNQAIEKNVDYIYEGETEKTVSYIVKDNCNIEKAILKSYLVQKGDYLYIPEDKIYIMNEIINMIM